MLSLTTALPWAGRPKAGRFHNVRTAISGEGSHGRETPGSQGASPDPAWSAKGNTGSVTGELSIGIPTSKRVMPATALNKGSGGERAMSVLGLLSAKRPWRKPGERSLESTQPSGMVEKDHILRVISKTQTSSPAGASALRRCA